MKCTVCGYRLEAGASHSLGDCVGILKEDNQELRRDLNQMSEDLAKLRRKVSKLSGRVEDLEEGSGYA